MSITKGKDGRKFDEAFKGGVADLASQPGAKQEQVARDLGVSPYGVARWKKQDATAPSSSSAGVNPQELERENRALRRENEDLRQQRSLLRKSTRHCLGSPARRHGVIRS